MEDGWKKPLFLLNWMEKYNNKVMTKLDAIENMFGTAGEADVAPTDIKSGKKAYNGTTLVTGTMPSNTAEQKLLSCGQSYSIPEGYHDGTGMVSADTLANQTAGTAAAGDVLISKTAYVNGSKVTGTMPEQGAKSKELACGEAYTIPAGHHNGQGKVTAKSLASQTGATAVATKLLAGLTAWVNGNKITGTMANKAGTTVKAAAVTQDDDNTYFAIPAAGYYDTASKVYTENSNLGEINVLVNNRDYTFGTINKNYTIEKSGKIIVIVDGMAVQDTPIVIITIKVNNITVLSTRKTSQNNAIYQYKCNANDVITVISGTEDKSYSCKNNIVIGQY